MYLNVNGTRLFFDVVGSSLQPVEREMKPKPTVIALHGGPGFTDHSYFRPYLDPLGEVAQLIYLDYRGCGRSARHPHEYYQLGIMADDVAAFCAELGIEKPVVFGHSFGGYVALTMAVRYPQLLAGLILAATAASEANYDDLECLEQLVGKDLREVAARVNAGQASAEERRRYDQAVLPLMNYPPKPEVHALRVARTIRNEDLVQYMKESDAQYDVRPHLTSITVPTLVLQGRFDWQFSMRAAEELAQNIPHARLHVFEQAAHRIHQDAPEALIQVIDTFLAAGLHKELAPTSSE